MHVRIEGVTKRYAGRPVLDDVTLDVAAGELLVVLGPSGSGKTTLLHAIAGLEEIDAGAVWFDGRDVTDAPAQARMAPLVLQRHALFPHLRVLDNVAFGPRMRGMPRAERERRARQALREVRLEGFEARYPAELSGGEAQRVAIARALVTQPRLLLMDEPFSSLDAHLRSQMQDLVLALQRSKGITTVFVTHDQREAVRLGDRIAVLQDGRLRQVGPAREVYDRPSTEETARFLGLTNILPARVRAGRVHIDGVGAFPLPAGVALAGRTAVRAAFRPESITLRASEETEGIPTRIAEVHDHGQTVHYALHLLSGTISAVELGPPRHAVGDDVRLVFEKPPWVLSADPTSNPAEGASAPDRSTHAPRRPPAKEAP